MKRVRYLLSELVIFWQSCGESLNSLCGRRILISILAFFLVISLHFLHLTFFNSSLYLPQFYSFYCYPFLPLFSRPNSFPYLPLAPFYYAAFFTLFRSALLPPFLASILFTGDPCLPFFFPSFLCVFLTFLSPLLPSLHTSVLCLFLSPPTSFSSVLPR